MSINNEDRIQTLITSCGITRFTSLTSHKKDLENKLLPLLKQKVFHITPYHSFTKILETGSIKANTSGEFGFHGSENSYGRKRGYVCLFDLRDKTDSVISDALIKFYFLGPHNFGDRLAYLILRSEFHAELKDYKQAHNEVGFKQTWIPQVECWYNKDIPVKNLDEIIMVNIIAFDCHQNVTEFV